MATKKNHGTFIDPLKMTDVITNVTGLSLVTLILYTQLYVKQL